MWPNFDWPAVTESGLFASDDGGSGSDIRREWKHFDETMCTCLNMNHSNNRSYKEY